MREGARGPACFDGRVPLPVSVVIPTYQRAHLVRRAVDSALAALEPGDEILVCDDGSTDGTAVALASYGDAVRHLVLPHAGAGPARNAGLDAARHPLIAFLDSDDEWFPDKMRMQRRVMEARPDVVYSFGDFAITEPDGTPHRNYLPHWQERPIPLADVLGPGVPFSTFGPLPAGRADFSVHVGDLYGALLEDNYVPTFTLVVRRTPATDRVRYATDLAFHEDWEYFARLAQEGPVAYLDTELTWQHGHKGPRLTQTDPYEIAACRLLMTQRLWGSDAAFRARHPGRVEALESRLHLVRAKRLLRRGRAGEARREMGLAGRGPLSWRLLSWLPGGLVRRGFNLLKGPEDPVLEDREIRRPPPLRWQPAAPSAGDGAPPPAPPSFPPPATAPPPSGFSVPPRAEMGFSPPAHSVDPSPGP